MVSTNYKHFEAFFNTYGSSGQVLKQVAIDSGTMQIRQIVIRLKNGGVFLYTV